METDAHVFLGLLKLDVDSVLKLLDLLKGPLLNDIGLLEHFLLERCKHVLSVDVLLLRRDYQVCEAAVKKKDKLLDVVDALQHFACGRTHWQRDIFPFFNVGYFDAVVNSFH